MNLKLIENTLRTVLVAALFIPPLTIANSLYFPYISGKAYFFRLVVEIALLLWIILLVKKPECRPNFKNPLIIVLLIFLGVLSLTALTGVDPINSFFSNTERSDGVIQFAHWILYFLMMISVFRKRNDWKFIIGLVVFLGLIVSVYSFLNYKSQPRLFGTFGNPSYLGAFMIFTIGFASLFFTKYFEIFKRENYKYLYILLGGLISIFTVALILTQTRGSYLGLFTGFAVLTILSTIFLRKEAKILVIILNIALIISIIFIFYIFTFKTSAIVLKYPIIQRVANTTDSSSMQERLIVWGMAVDGFKDRPILGWGPENFGVLYNKYYNYKVGLSEPWFDKPHNQALQYLAEGGLILFFAYIALIGSVLLLLLKIFKKEQLVAIILLSLYAGYLIQSFFLFDTLPLLLGEFIMFGFIYFLYESFYGVKLDSKQAQKNKFKNDNKKGNQNFYIGTVFLIIIIGFLIRATVWVPFKANRFIREYFGSIYNKDYESASLILDKLFKVTSQYSYADIRKAAGWDFLRSVLGREITEKNRQVILELYSKIVPELENWVHYRPYDSQSYYVLASIYRLGYEKLGRAEDLANADIILRKAMEYSSDRVDYVDEFSQILIHEKKFDELNNVVANFVSQIDINDPYRYLTIGNSYFMQGEYVLAMKEYETAISLGYIFWSNDNDYIRYIQAAEKTGEYNKLIKMGEEYIKNKGQNPIVYYHIAVTYLKLNQKKLAQSYFSKAVELDERFKNYSEIFK